MARMEGKDLAYWLADKIPAYGDYAKQAAQVLRDQADEIERLRKLTQCGCGDSFADHDPGTCGNCMAGKTSELELLRNEVAAWRARFPQYEYRAQDECVSLKTEFIRFGCHCDLEPHMTPDDCLIDEGRHQDCIHAVRLVRGGKGKESCEHWKQYTAAMVKP